MNPTTAPRAPAPPRAAPSARRAALRADVAALRAELATDLARPPASAAPDPWIGVAEVAAELNIAPRRAWELIKRLGVELIGGPGNRMDEARFRLSKWEAARDAAQRPAPARSPRARPPKATTIPKAADKLAEKLRALKLAVDGDSADARRAAVRAEMLAALRNA